MSMEKRSSELLFNTIAALFSALLLVLSLLCAVETAAVNDRAAALEKENERLKTENQILQTRLDNSLSLEELETYALEELGMQESGLDRMIKCSYELLGLISFLTAGADECRAWTIRKGTKAPQAAGKIHSDFERGFIRAEIVSFEDLKANGSMAACKEKGLVRSEGKDYVMQDGDVTLCRFNV